MTEQPFARGAGYSYSNVKRFDCSSILRRTGRALRTFMARYQQMDLADASVVVMSELHARSQVLTVDRTDFSVYRRNDRQVIDFVAPQKR